MKNRVKRCKFAIFLGFSIRFYSRIATFRKFWHFLRDAQSYSLSKDIKFAGDDRTILNFDEKFWVDMA